MRYMRSKKKKSIRHFSQLPIDERLVPDIFSFSHVHGIARIFLITEILLSSLVVLGTVILVVIHALL